MARREFRNGEWIWVPDNLLERTFGVDQEFWDKIADKVANDIRARESRNNDLSFSGEASSMDPLGRGSSSED